MPERQQGDVDLRLDAALLELACELEHHREAALHVARAESDDGAVLDPAGDVLLGRNGVVVAGEHDERRAPRAADGPTRTHPRPSYSGAKEAGTSERTWAAISASCLLSEGMSTSSSVRSASRFARSDIGRKRGTILQVTTRQPPPGVQPERGLVLAVLPRAPPTPKRSSAELARARPYRGRRADRRAWCSSARTPIPRTYVGKGKLEELKQVYEDAHEQALIVDDELEAGAAEGNSRRPGRRASSTARSDPRHLRAAR